MRQFLSYTFLWFCFVSALESGETSRNDYLQLLKHHPRLIENRGDDVQGEIQIILDPNRMAEIENKTGRDVGLIHQDKYWLWINDACMFPSGKEGVYGRILWTASLETTPGVAVIPILPDGKVVLICNFRHATRSWEIELPRGSIIPGEKVEEAAKREMLEETGMVASDLFYLGEVASDTGLTNTVVPVFSAAVVHQSRYHPEDTEAIEEILCLSIDEIKAGFHSGFLKVVIRGTEHQVPLRDPFLAYALFMYEIKKI